MLRNDRVIRSASVILAKNCIHQCRVDNDVRPALQRFLTVIDIPRDTAQYHGNEFITRRQYISPVSDSNRYRQRRHLGNPFSAVIEQFVAFHQTNGVKVIPRRPLPPSKSRKLINSVMETDRVTTSVYCCADDKGTAKNIAANYSHESISMVSAFTVARPSSVSCARKLSIALPFRLLPRERLLRTGDSVSRMFAVSKCSCSGELAIAKYRDKHQTISTGNAAPAAFKHLQRSGPSGTMPTARDDHSGHFRRHSCKTPSRHAQRHSLRFAKRGNKRNGRSGVFQHKHAQRDQYGAQPVA